ncbi:beta-glucan synthesis-associated protein [Tilletia horrida]|nr:beta-glucan synthesis-associated protein [Tilletia horrida]
MSAHGQHHEPEPEQAQGQHAPSSSAQLRLSSSSSASRFSPSSSSSSSNSAGADAYADATQSIAATSPGGSHHALPPAAAAAAAAAAAGGSPPPPLPTALPYQHRQYQQSPLLSSADAYSRPSISRGSSEQQQHQALLSASSTPPASSSSTFNIHSNLDAAAAAAVSGRQTPLLFEPPPPSGRQTPLMDLHNQITSGRETPIDWDARPPSALGNGFMRPDTPDSMRALSPRPWTRRIGSGSFSPSGGNGTGSGYFGLPRPRSGLSHRHPGPEPPGTPEPLAFSPLDGKFEKEPKSYAEDDDELHDPYDADEHTKKIGFRGFLNIATLVFIACGLLSLFGGYPVISYLMHVRSLKNSILTGFNVGGTNGTGQIPDLNIRQIIDPQTPPNAHTFISAGVDKTLKPTNRKFNLVFSDEFNEEGRTFWHGDDPFWEAVDIWYGATFDYEWYSPEAINTTGGNLVIALEAMPIHNLNFRSGMLQSWNKICYQGGYIEFNMLQPGNRDTMGYWPALWMMGNLGRPGYLGSTEGLWPYSYNSCDAGIMPKQLYWNESAPLATVQGTGVYSKPFPTDPNGPDLLSWLPGMRFPSCTCPGEDHPGPNVNVGRSAAELDVIESQIQYHGAFHSYASQSMQTAPFDAGYQWSNRTDVDYHIYNNAITRFNDYLGSPLQECTSGLTQVPDDGFEESQTPRFIKYGVEYEPDWAGNGEQAYVTWYVDGKPSWTVFGSALAPRKAQDIGQRLVPVEPMSIIMNLGMATGFQPVRFTGPNAMTIPTSMKVDYVRLYQADGQKPLIGCDPPDHPTLDYINNHPDLYYNHDLTSFNQTQHKWPRNKLTTGC